MAKSRSGSQRRHQRAQERRKRRTRERVRPTNDPGGRPRDIGTPDGWWRSALRYYGSGGEYHLTQSLGGLVAGRVDRVDAVVWDDFGDWLPTLWKSGWQPREVAHVVRKHLNRTHGDLAAVLMLEQSHRYRAHFRDPQWLAQLDEMHRTTGWPDLPEGPGLLSRYGARCGLDRLVQVRAAVELADLITSLPKVPVVAPYPGDRSPTAKGHPGLPAKLLEKVQGLLRKAETTEFPAEAEALAAKAQELVSGSGIQAILDSLQGGETREAPVARRILIDDPHAEGRALLLQQIAEANRCRTMWARELGISTVTGFAADVDFVVLLHASLLVQATRAMTAHGSVTDHSGARRTASFRRSFLVSYATRIGERLTEQVRATEAAAGDDRLLPVLRSRADDVDAFARAMLGDTYSHRISTSHGGGAAAGYVAADAANLTLFDELESA